MGPVVKGTNGFKRSEILKLTFFCCFMGGSFNLATHIFTRLFISVVLPNDRSPSILGHIIGLNVQGGGGYQGPANNLGALFKNFVMLGSPFGALQAI